MCLKIFQKTKPLRIRMWHDRAPCIRGRGAPRLISACIQIITVPVALSPAGDFPFTLQRTRVSHVFVCNLCPGHCCRGAELGGAIPGCETAEGDAGGLGSPGGPPNPPTAVPQPTQQQPPSDVPNARSLLHRFGRKKIKPDDGHRLLTK